MLKNCASLTKSINRVRGAGYGIRKGLNAGKSYATRGSHTIPKGRKSQADTDSGLVDPNLSVWRSINAEHKEVEQVPTDLTENIMNYYKERWIQEHKDRKQTETISGTEVTREEGSSTDRRSIYSQLARKTANTNRPHPGKMPPGFNFHDESATMKSYDPYTAHQTPGNANVAIGKINYNQDIEMRDLKSQLRHNETPPGLWEKNPYNKGIPTMSFEPNKMPQEPPAPQTRTIDPNVPYRPSFSVADMLSNRADTANRNENIDETPEAKPSKRLSNNDNKKEATELNTSPFQPAAPPVPDFKSS